MRYHRAMAQMKAHQVDAWLKRPDPPAALVLVYGPDRGMVSERANAFARSIVPDIDDPFAVTRIDAADVEADPGRLFDEIATVPMFGGERLIWISGSGGKALASAVKDACDAIPGQTAVLIETGELKKGAALRSAAETHKRAMALPCYADNARDMDRLIDEALHAAGQTMTLDARTAFKTVAGGDRLATRSELEKLVLYAAGKPAIELDDVKASAGDSAGLSMDDVVDSVLTGRLDTFELAFARHCRAGTKPFLLAAAAMRQFHALQLMRDAYENHGKTAAAIVAGHKPPVFYSRKVVVERAISLWPLSAIGRALERLQAAVFTSRRHGDLEEETIRQALLALALESKTRARN